ncbi:hypothetical protein CASFOL_007268 [Castilleja foliolosa]|uniref:TFIIS central domain-containing protein n=1 Tax=Castilleja foliolosa TaxID=1961234 RepID=A0ABD3E8R5_9LAMI
MEHFSHPLDLPVSEMHMKMAGQVSSNPESHHFYAPMPISSNTVFGTSMAPNNGVGHNESSGVNVVPTPIYIPDQFSNKDVSAMNNHMADEKAPPPVKRKAEFGPLGNNSISPRSSLPNKRPAHMGTNVSSAGFLHSSAPQRKTTPAQSKLGTPVQQSQSKKMARNDSMSGKSGLQRGQSAKKQTAQIESASKVRPESSEAVRSKMRETLAAALALAFQKQDDVSNTEKNQSDLTIIQQPVNSRASELDSSVGGNVPISGSENSKESSAFSTPNECQLFTAEQPNGSSGNGGQDFEGFQYSSILPDEDSFGNTFFAKDDLLQGNGLSWAFDFDAQMREERQEALHDDEDPKFVKEVTQATGKVVPVLTPENLASEIEAELFKLFGGVNKKYREKGRSLMFNLKDRNNPDLRESVMSGEISPEKLCSMSAEELASKELSQWRMAKAEEFAQMVVLPDTEVDVRRLVKKTHKGEYQVEVVDHDDGIAAEVSSGTSMLTRSQPKKETKPHSPLEASLKDKDRVAEDQDFSGSLIIPTDGTDLMQGMIVDEFKDAELLPPIVSLDEFMESLNNEPPFDDLSGGAGQKTPTPHRESPKLVKNSRPSDRAPDTPKDALSKKAGVFTKHDVITKSNLSPVKQKNVPSIMAKAECIWNGTLQLHISSSITVGGLFQSGEKTSMKEWPRSLEIKGRVRLDAFEKFIQELPNSRTRAVMVLQFVLKDTSSEIQRANLSEAIDSYILDERLGYAEPAPGVELYLCPSTPKINDTLKKLIPKEQPETNNTTGNGLIGAVVWRRAHISNTISPNSSSHHKQHASKKQPFASPAPQRAHNSSNVNANNTPPPVFNNRAEPEKDEDDDIPPGFGPAAAARADDDDLPEFNFSNSSVARQNVTRQNVTQRPVDQVRELIKKYGQSGNNVVANRSRVNNMNNGIEPWNDDEDDIPEWRPQQQLQPPYGAAAHHSRRPPPVHLAPNQYMMTNQPPPNGPGHQGLGGRWVRPPRPTHGPRWGQY